MEQRGGRELLEGGGREGERAAVTAVTNESNTCPA